MTYLIFQDKNSEPFLKDRTAIVTGADGSIGSYLCEALLKNGAYVYGFYNKSKENINKLSRNYDKFTGISIDFLSEDYSQKINEIIKKIARERGSLDILIHSAGIFSMKPFLYEILEERKKVWRVNYETAVELSNSFLRFGKREIDKSKHVIFIASLSGVRGTAQQIAYSNSKSALISLAQGLAEEFGSSHDLCANVISPGAIPTKLLREFIPDLKAERLLAKSVPKYRLCSIEDVTNACLGILMNNFYNGENFVLHGGKLP